MEFEPWPGRTRLERTFVLLDLGVQFSNPPWQRCAAPHGNVADRSEEGPDGWYVDLITVEQNGNDYFFRDLYVDVMIPMDGRQHRLLDLEEFADALADGVISVDVAVDGLRRWQAFLDQHLYGARHPTETFVDFPPESIRELAESPAPLGPIVRYEWPEETS